MSMAKKRIAFLCVHNSCRSQMAEALGRHLAGDRFEFYSAGTETKPRINQDAVRLMKLVYGIDMEQEQYSKTIDKIPAPDLVISMGCDVGWGELRTGPISVVHWSRNLTIISSLKMTS